MFGREELEVAQEREVVNDYVAGMDEQIEEWQSTKTGVVEANKSTDLIGINPFSKHDIAGKIMAVRVGNEIDDDGKHRDVIGVDDTLENVYDFPDL